MSNPYVSPKYQESRPARKPPQGAKILHWWFWRYLILRWITITLAWGFTAHEPIIGRMEDHFGIPFDAFDACLVPLSLLCTLASITFWCAAFWGAVFMRLRVSPMWLVIDILSWTAHILAMLPAVQ